MFIWQIKKNRSRNKSRITTMSYYKKHRQYKQYKTHRKHPTNKGRESGFAEQNAERGTGGGRIKQDK